jgi:hypothetical protein
VSKKGEVVEEEVAASTDKYEKCVLAGHKCSK